MMNFKLVDYDGIYVPSLAGWVSNEDGERNYQHPRRNASDFGLYLDNFSAWVIYLALMSISLDANLRARVKKDDENLLLRRNDYLLNNPSSLLLELEKHSNYYISSLATKVHSLIYLDPKSIPSLQPETNIPFLQTQRSPANKPDWVEDLQRVKTIQPFVEKEDNVKKQDEPWVFSFFSPVKPRSFAGNFLIPKVLLSVTFWFSILIIFVNIWIFTGLRGISIDQSLINGTARMIVAIISIASLCLGYSVDLLVFYWFYLHNSTTREMLNLRKQEKSILEEINQINKEVLELQKKGKRINTVENDYKKAYDNSVVELRGREQRECNKLKTDMNTELIPIENNFKNMNLLESKKLSELNATVGSRIQSYYMQLSTLTNAERKEIDSTIRSLEDNYIASFLKQNNIRNAPLRGQKYTSRSVLESSLINAGITTAYDISYYRVDAVYGFGPVRTQALVNWKAKLEATARTLIPPDLLNNAKIIY